MKLDSVAWCLLGLINRNTSSLHRPPFGELHLLPRSAQKPYKRAAPASKRPSVLGEQNENSNGLNTRIDLSKQYFKLLQALHHLEILNSAIEKESYPIGMTK